jgi:deazaflavin-dependent oxidoreductase (nitroreductase family)
VRITFGGQTKAMRVRRVSDEEKAQLWPVCCEYYPPYQDYQTRTDRNIPVFVCE